MAKYVVMVTVSTAETEFDPASAQRIKSAISDLLEYNYDFIPNMVNACCAEQITISDQSGTYELDLSLDA